MQAKRLERHAAFYRGLGLNPLPSKAIDGRMHPPFRYGPARDSGLSAESFTKIAERLGCSAVQVATGARWGLAVLDLDGPMAREVWRAWSLFREHPPTWAVQHDPEGGMHLWFRCPKDKPLPHKTVLWRLEGVKHAMIELLGDGNLIVAPPSVSPKSGRRYRFLPGRSPRDLPEPAPLPAWVAALPDVSSPPPPPPKPFVAAPAVVAAPAAGRNDSLDRAVVLRAVADPVGLARTLGVRVVDERPNRSGWLRCRSLYREDRRPSAAIKCDEKGFVYWEPGMRALSIFDVAVQTGAAPDFSRAVDLVGRLLGAG